MDQYLSAQEVADRLGLSLSSVYGWLRQGRLPSTRLSEGRVVVSESELCRWLQMRSISAEAALDADRADGSAVGSET